MPSPAARRTSQSGRVPVSEHALMLVLASMKRLVWGDKAVRDGTGWAERSKLSLVELEGSTVGIIGIGFLGSEIARKLKYGFRCHVLGYDPYADPRLTCLADVEMVPDLYDLLGHSQVLILAPALTDETRNMIGAPELAALPRGANVINVGRGQVLDLDALAAALDSGQVLAAGLDVFYPERRPNGHPLLSNPKVTLTPHIGGITAEASSQLAHLPPSSHRMPEREDAEVCGESGSVDRVGLSAAGVSGACMISDAHSRTRLSG